MLHRILQNGLLCLKHAALRPALQWQAPGLERLPWHLQLRAAVTGAFQELFLGLALQSSTRAVQSRPSPVPLPPPACWHPPLCLHIQQQQVLGKDKDIHPGRKFIL